MGTCHQESTARKQFSHFDISDTSRSGRPSGFDEDSLNILIHNDPRQCTRELANVMNCDHSTIVRHSQSMDQFQKSAVWVLHAPSEGSSTRSLQATCDPPTNFVRHGKFLIRDRFLLNVHFNQIMQYCKITFYKIENI